MSDQVAGIEEKLSRLDHSHQQRPGFLIVMTHTEARAQCRCRSNFETKLPPPTVHINWYVIRSDQCVYTLAVTGTIAIKHTRRVSCSFPVAD